mgnify:CR=1 FL=1
MRLGLAVDVVVLPHAVEVGEGRRVAVGPVDGLVERVRLDRPVVREVRVVERGIERVVALPPAGSDGAGEAGLVGRLEVNRGDAGVVVARRRDLSGRGGDSPHALFH